MLMTCKTRSCIKINYPEVKNEVLMFNRLITVNINLFWLYVMTINQQIWFESNVRVSSNTLLSNWQLKQRFDILFERFAVVKVIKWETKRQSNTIVHSENQMRCKVNSKSIIIFMLSNAFRVSLLILHNLCLWMLEIHQKNLLESAEKNLEINF